MIYAVVRKKIVCDIGQALQ